MHTGPVNGTGTKPSEFSQTDGMRIWLQCTIPATCSLHIASGMYKGHTAASRSADVRDALALPLTGSMLRSLAMHSALSERNAGVHSSFAQDVETAHNLCCCAEVQPLPARRAASR